MKKTIVRVICLLLIALSLSGCNNLQTIDEQDSEQNYGNGQNSTIAKPSKLINLAGWIVINDNRLYLDEAKVFIQELPPHEPLYPLYSRHAGENVIVIADGDNERLYEYGFFRDYFWQEYYWGNGIWGYRQIDRTIGNEENFFKDEDGFYRDDGTFGGGRWEARRKYGIMPNGYGRANGYAIEHLGRNIASFEVTSNTVFTFTDTNLHFVDKFSMDRKYPTTTLEEFLMHRGISNRLHCFYNIDYVMTPEEFLLRSTCECALRRYPIVFIQVKDGRVISVTEEFLFTQ
jgi:hypothetical protein